MAAADLNPCPCGGTPAIQTGYDGVSDFWLVECPKCERGTDWKLSEADAVNAWNLEVADGR